MVISDSGGYMYTWHRPGGGKMCLGHSCPHAIHSHIPVCQCWFRQEDLFRILKAYSVHNTTDGYCQAQAPIAAVLLMHMPAEQAFWCLVSICEKYLPGYYSAGLVSWFLTNLIETSHHTVS